MQNKKFKIFNTVGLAIVVAITAILPTLKTVDVSAVNNDSATNVVQNNEVVNVGNASQIEEFMGVTPASIGGVGFTIAETFPDSEFASYISNLLKVDATTVLTQGMLDSVWDIKLFDTDVSDLTGIENFSKLMYLTIENARFLTQLPEGVGNLTNLTTLYIERTPISHLPESIGDIKLLTYLILRDGKLTSIPDSIGNLAELRRLDLTNNHLTSIPDTIGNLTNLTELNLSYNQLVEIPETISDLTKLTLIDLSVNQLTTIPDSFSRFTNLSILQLDDNLLTTIPTGVVNLTYLKELYISGNPLTVIPENIENLESLEVLHLGGYDCFHEVGTTGSVGSLPETIGNLTNLESLTMSCLGLTTFPDTIGNLTNLTELNLSYNQLVEIPETIGNLTKLEHLNLASNQLTAIPETIGDVTNLKDIGFDYNQLTTIPKSIVNLTKLEYVYIKDNLLTELPDFPIAPNLSFINLTSNYLSQLPKSIIDLPNLEQITLIDNEFTNIPNLKSGTKVYLAYNLLPENYAELVTDLGLWHFPYDASSLLYPDFQKHIELKPDLNSYTIKYETEIFNIDYSSIIIVEPDQSLGGFDHNERLFQSAIQGEKIWKLDNYVDENDNPVNIEDYIQDGEVIKEGLVYAQVSATTVGAMTTLNENAITSGKIALELLIPTPVAYNLSFDLNGSDDIIPATQSVNYAQVGTYVTDPVWPGYTFLGWNTVQDGTGLTWDLSTTTMPSNDVVLYAQWEVIPEQTLTYTIRANNFRRPLMDHLSATDKVDFILLNSNARVWNEETEEEFDLVEIDTDLDSINSIGPVQIDFSYTTPLGEETVTSIIGEFIGDNTTTNSDMNVSISANNVMMHFEEFISTLNIEDTLLSLSNATAWINQTVEIVSPLQFGTDLSLIQEGGNYLIEVFYEDVDGNRVATEFMLHLFEDDGVVLPSKLIMQATPATIHLDQAKEVTDIDALLILATEAKAFESLTGNEVEVTVKSRGFNEFAVGTYEVVLTSTLNDQTVEISVFVTFVDDNTVLNDSDWAMIGDNVIMTLEEYDELLLNGLIDQTILTESNAKAWDRITNTTLSPLTVDRSLVKSEVGTYGVNLDYTDGKEVIEKTIYLTLTSENTVIDVHQNLAISGEDVIMSLAQLKEEINLGTLTKNLLLLSNAKAWETNGSGDVYTSVHIDVTPLLGVKYAGEYLVELSYEDRISTMITVIIVDEPHTNEWDLLAEDFELSIVELETIMREDTSLIVERFLELAKAQPITEFEAQRFGVSPVISVVITGIKIEVGQQVVTYKLITESYEKDYQVIMTVTPINDSVDDKQETNKKLPSTGLSDSTIPFAGSIIALGGLAVLASKKKKRTN